MASHGAMSGGCRDWTKTCSDVTRKTYSRPADGSQHTHTRTHTHTHTHTHSMLLIVDDNGDDDDTDDGEDEDRSILTMREISKRLNIR